MRFKTKAMYWLLALVAVFVCIALIVVSHNSRLHGRSFLEQLAERGREDLLAAATPAVGLWLLALLMTATNGEKREPAAPSINLYPAMFGGFVKLLLEVAAGLAIVGAILFGILLVIRWTWEKAGLVLH